MIHITKLYYVFLASSKLYLEASINSPVSRAFQSVGFR